MAFDQSTRNRLQRFVSDARRVLENEFTRQLQNEYGMDPSSGAITPLENLRHLTDAQRETARILRDTLAHYRATPGTSAQTGLDRIVREQAFTVLNRLAALRMAEARGLLIESVGNGYQAKGFQLYGRLAASALGEMGDTYRSYLASVFDEIAKDLPVLFQRYSPQGRLFPRESALLELLALINSEDINSLWSEDETIGWIYQFFNSKEERKRMRDESAAPRNSRELAVRNQFFTPRYVVEFLTDNALGRTWYEMTKGETHLSDRCRYLIRRTDERFLQAEEEPPAPAIPEGQNQDELLRQPVYIPHRPLKDPREIRMLDPACGSMHFGLYAFDLFEVIYQEAWELAQQDHPGHARAKESPSFAPFLTWVRGFGSHQEYSEQIPRFIIEHNIHGIDIDPRAVQIAGLSLWLRAQRAWHDQGIRLQQRPPIQRSNVVCAEPMPGEGQFLDEFIDAHLSRTPEERLLGQLVRRVFVAMTLAGEAGALLKIEDEIAGFVADAKQQWVAGPKPIQGRLFADDASQGVQQPLGLDVSGITNEAFWSEAEERIYSALRAYAEKAERGEGYQRRLFAGDAVRGFAFIDICRQRYDVVLMNPPFGDASLPSKPYLDDTYGDTKGDVYKAFVECFQARLVPAGFLGIISSRTGFFLGQSEDWRTRVVLRLFRPIALADLGSGVLDAMVEVAAYVLRSLSTSETRDLTFSIVPTLSTVMLDSQGRFSLPKWQAARDGLKRHQAMAELEHLETANFIQRCPGDIVRFTPNWQTVRAVGTPKLVTFPLLVCIRATSETKKDQVIGDAVSESSHPLRFECNPSVFQRLPSAPFAYWLTPGLQRIFDKFKPFLSNGRDVRQGLATADDYRFLRLWWEIDQNKIFHPKAHPHTWSGAYCVTKQIWTPICRGGSRQTFYRDLHTVIDWYMDGQNIRNFKGSVVRNPDFYFRPGFSWPLRGITFSAQAVPSGSVFSVAGKLACTAKNEDLLPLLAIANSSVFNHLLTLFAGKVGGVQYEVGLLSRIPTPTLDLEDSHRLKDLAHRGWSTRRRKDSVEETSHAFVQPALLVAPGITLRERAAAWTELLRASEETLSAIQSDVDDLAFSLYGMNEYDRAALNTTIVVESIDNGLSDTVEELETDETNPIDAAALVADLISYFMGAAFGRWDIGFAIRQKPIPAVPEPFDPLPVCAPGQLQNAFGMPVTRNQITSGYPIHIPWDGILADDASHVLDIGHHVRLVIESIWNHQAEAIEHEICEIFGGLSIFDYLRKQNAFFADHLKRNSKSRRQAPIYWPLSTSSGSYTLWIYYHRLTEQTFFTCINDFVEPKLRQVSEDLSRLRQSGANRSREDEKHFEELQILEQELFAFRDELLRVANLPWKPNLNDGVEITAAPLWQLFRHRPWQRTLRETWEKLQRGDFDWAHTALSLWPERVREKCKTDKSLAIAHGLEDLYIEPEAKPKKSRGRKKAGSDE